jgi:aminoglycoside phosphotransferase (APT) family kinase protein
MDITDKATAIRGGEELDTATVETFLKDAIPGLTGRLMIKQFPRGHSNLTYLLTVGEKEFVLRRPPFGTKAKSAHDMGREYKMLSALRPVFPYCPEPLVYTEDTSIIGSPFYVMERLCGIILPKDLPAGLNLTPEHVAELCDRLIDVLVELHSIDYNEIGLGNYGKPEGYVKRQVEGWSQRYRNARTPDAPDFEEGMMWLHEHMPPESPRPAIVHNDYKLDNVVLDERNPVKIIGVLDWEMATVGDPLMDLGNSLAYWVQRDDPPEMEIVRLMPTDLEGAPIRSQIVERYAEKSGCNVERFDFYYCFGLFRLAVIAQQIYYRYYHGQTTDERFKMMIHAVKVLEKTARRVISESKH